MLPVICRVQIEWLAVSKNEENWIGNLCSLCSVLRHTSQIVCYIDTIPSMASEPRLSHTAAMILQAVNAGYIYGFSIMEMTGLPSGTVYPAMRRLERDELIRSHWEQQSIADAEQRPPRKYYKVTRAGKATLEASQKRYPLLAKLVPPQEVKSL